MKFYKLLTFKFLILFFVSCEEEKNIFSIDTTSQKLLYSPAESIDFLLKNEKNKSIDSVIYYWNEKKIGKSIKNEPLHLSLADAVLGIKNTKALIYFEGNTATATATFTIVASEAPKKLGFKIINTYPHDIKAYTQGLEFFANVLYEGTGNGAGAGTGIRGITSVKKINYQTGEVLQKTELPDKYFGEGITILNEKLYQLTYKNNECFVYDVANFAKVNSFHYFKDMEGWGLTNDGENLYMSDGSEKIYKINPDNFELIDNINVYTNTLKIDQINELEWIEGKIWANIYQKESIIIINPKNGAIEGVLDCRELKEKVTQHPDLDAFNGIAYNPITKTIFITGKNWDKMFEIVLE